MLLKSILSKVNSWAEFKNALKPLIKLEKGNAFEELTKYYLLSNPVYKDKLKNVWLQKEIPPSVTQKLNLPTNDQGIDLIAENYDGTFWAIQCKYLQDEEQSLTHRAISTFTSLSKLTAKNISYCLVATTADDYAKLYKGNNDIGFINADEWNKLNKGFFKNVRTALTGKEIKYKPYKPKPHQQKALQEASEHFLKQKNNRGKLVFPCGAGKSLTGYWIKQVLNAHSTIVAVPSLSLVKQTLEVYLRESVANKQKIEWLCVCSDEGIGKNDDVVIHTNEIGVPCITDKNFIANWIKTNKKNRTVIFTTYQSGKTIAEAAQIAKSKFDLGIMDEAHKTVGDQDKLFSYLLFDNNIKIDKRIFMTATERRYAGSSENILSMDDTEVYGETFTQMPFKEAINEGILSDYKIITLFISDEEVKEIIEKNAFVKPEGKEWDNQTEARTLASMVALRKAMKQFPIHHAVTFHSSIKKAQAFEQSQVVFSKAFPKFQKIDSFHVSGAMPTSQRSKIVNEFAASKKAVITNAKCLTEGVDVPNIDCVLFADPRKSTVDIVQAVGRALRKKEGKQFGYVILPVFTKSKTKEEIIESAEFKEILSTLRALASNDERIIEYFRDISKKGKSNSSNSGLVQFDIDEEIIERISEKDLIDSLQLKTWDKLAKLSWMPFEEAREFVRGLKIKSKTLWSDYCKSNKKPFDIPSTPERSFKNIGWKGWGDWLGTDSIATWLKKYRNFDDARDYVRALKLKNQAEWLMFCSSGKKPEDIPSNANVTYKNNGWISLGDWLGTDVIANNNRQYRDFLQAKKFVHNLKLKNQSEWSNYCKSGEKPIDIPSNPNMVYKDSGWIGMGDWIGTGYIASKFRNYKNFSEAKIFVHLLKLKNQKEWIQYCRSGNKPDDIPTTPERVYKNTGWIGIGDWLGTGTIAPFLREYKKFDLARKFVHGLKLKNQKEWKEYCRSEKKPIDIPAKPSDAYKEDGWISMGDWLGTGNVATYYIKYKDFDTAREFVHSLNLRRGIEWKEYCKSGKKPNDIPTYPNDIYANMGWVSMGDWLGSPEISNKNRQYRKFSEARQFVISLKLKNLSQWHAYCKSGEKPIDIPTKPERIYRNNGWKGAGDWLGTGRISNYSRVYLEFSKAKEFVHKLNLRGQNDWKNYCKSGKKPEFIPSNPNSTYKKNGWTSFGDWLGNGVTATSQRIYKDFSTAKKYVRSLHLQSSTEWSSYCKSGKKPSDIPNSPNQVYKNDGWVNWGDWLGTKIVATWKRDYLTFEEARKFVRKLKLKSYNEWLDFCKSGKKPESIPAKPMRTYANNGWISMGDWLGSNNIATFKREYLSFVLAKSIVIKLGLKSYSQWKLYCKSGKKNDKIPNAPDQVYKDKGWKGWADFLGKEEISDNKK